MIVFRLSKLWKARLSMRWLWYLWGGCWGNLKLITLGSERFEARNKHSQVIITGRVNRAAVLYDSFCPRFTFIEIQPRFQVALTTEGRRNAENDGSIGGESHSPDGSHTLPLVSRKCGVLSLMVGVFLVISTVVFSAFAVLKVTARFEHVAGPHRWVKLWHSIVADRWAIGRKISIADKTGKTGALAQLWLGGSSLRQDCCSWLTFRLPARELSSESKERLLTKMTPLGVVVVTPYDRLYGEAPPERGPFFGSGIRKCMGKCHLWYLKGGGELLPMIDYTGRLCPIGSLFWPRYKKGLTAISNATLVFEWGPKH